MIQEPYWPPKPPKHTYAVEFVRSREWECEADTLEEAQELAEKERGYDEVTESLELSGNNQSDSVSVGPAEWRPFLSKLPDSTWRIVRTPQYPCVITDGRLGLVWSNAPIGASPETVTALTITPGAAAEFGATGESWSGNEHLPCVRLGCMILQTRYVWVIEQLYGDALQWLVTAKLMPAVVLRDGQVVAFLMGLRANELKETP